MEEHVFSRDQFWYLEVIAVHPDAQGMGVGRQMMDWLFDRIGDQHCILECTAEANVAIYERFGFHVVEVVDLEDKQGSTREWLMVRKGTRGTKNVP